ncbi:MAG TPA: F0F1 ATP synthase subunit epsilon [Chitinispirillaceae bacterium]|nr:F0F1 ATP synthase subunit epsilon [Chitinispirillaceae bacterium]
METFHIKIVTPEGLIFDKPIWQITACNSNGWFAIRAHHTDFFTSLKSCQLELAVTPENREKLDINSGFLEFQRNGGCTVICEKKKQ